MCKLSNTVNIPYTDIIKSEKLDQLEKIFHFSDTGSYNLSGRIFFL